MKSAPFSVPLINKGPNDIMLSSKTAVIHDDSWYAPRLDMLYHEMAEHYDKEVLSDAIPVTDK